MKRGRLVLLLLGLFLSFLRGYWALGPAGVVWYLQDLDPPVEFTETASRLVPLNSADVDELVVLPGIGPVLARRITEYRELIGGYQDLRQLLAVKGVGQATFGKIEPYLTLGELSDS